MTTRRASTRVDMIAAPPAAARGPRQVIVHADDLGLTYSFNVGILQAHRAGILTSTSIRANGFAYEDAVAQVVRECPRLGVGLHLCLNEARPVAPRECVPRLLGKDGCLRPGYAWLIRLATRPIGLAQIECELRAQIERVLADGVPIAHFDSHQHVHMIPAIFRIVCRLACEYGIDCVRLTREPRHSVGPWPRSLAPLRNGNALKHTLLHAFARCNVRTAAAFGIRFPEAFVGINYTGCMNFETVTAGLTAANARQVEVLLHPATGPDARDTAYPAEYLREYVASPQRRVELETLTSKELREWLQGNGWTTGDYASVLGARIACPPRGRLATIAPDIDALCTTASADTPPWVSAALPDARAFTAVVTAQVQPADRVLDLGTGSGILAICLAQRGVDVVATDICSGAVRTALRNAALHGVQFECFTSDLLDTVTGRFDAIACNVPYNFRPDTAVMKVIKHLARRVPFILHNSGTGMPQGVMVFRQAMMRRMLPQAFAHLRPGGLLLLHVYDFEVGIFRRMLPEGATVDVLLHPAFRPNRSVAMIIRTARTALGPSADVRTAAGAEFCH